jgi:hypothetical protein
MAEQDKLLLETATPKKTAEEEMADEAASYAKYARDWKSASSSSRRAFFHNESEKKQTLSYLFNSISI